MRYIRKNFCVESGSYCCLIAMFIILSNFIAIALSQVVVSQHHSECTIEQTHASVQGIYSAPARYVPAPPVDPYLQQEFIKLFQYDPSHNHSISRGRGTSLGLLESLPPGLDQSDLDYIASVCPPDAFFYSLSPQHLSARNMLQRYLAAQPTAAEVLRVARILLKSRQINPKIWYFSFIAAVMERSDLSGYSVPPPLFSMPDLFLPSPVLSEALSRFGIQYQGSHHALTINPSPTLQPFSNQIDYSDEEFVSSATASAINNPHRLASQAGKKGKVRRRRVRKGRLRSKNSLLPTETSQVPVPGHDPDSAGSEIREVVERAPNRKRHVNDITDGIKSTTATYKLSYGEEDDDYDELKRIHDTSGNNTRLIRQRILQRRMRRKKGKVKRQVYQPTAFIHHDGTGECVLFNGTHGSDTIEENRLWYFREDIMVNQHHWYWHQVYPLNATRHGDRRAELFFFMHRNIVARYNAERLANGLARTTELSLQAGSVIEDGYNSHLIDMNSRRFWTPRQPHTPLQDIFHEEDPDFAQTILMKDLTDLYYKIVYSIRDGALLGPNNQPIPIRNRDGIEHLGNIVEASELSINPLYYHAFGLHNLAHNAIGLSADPQFLARLPTGVMADTATTMRDPAFYVFHSGIDNLFDRYKRTLPPYQLRDGEWPLAWDGVAISEIQVIPHLNDGNANSLRTFWSTHRFPLESGIDNSIHNGDVRADVCAMHLNHEPFTFRLTVNVNPCVNTLTRQGTVRIFMAPRYDEQGRRFPLRVQRRLMFQLDAFPVKLQQGKNVIVRSSEDSSATKPWPTTLQEQFYKTQGPAGGAADYCGCGWPRHMQIPKGTPHGMEFDIFAMVTNYDEDVVHDSVEDLQIPEPCNSPYLFCGIPWRRYPDLRPMGYPFDRMPYKVPAGCTLGSLFPDMLCKLIQPEWLRMVETLEEYVHAAPNMGMSTVVVQHVDTIV